MTPPALICIHAEFKRRDRAGLCFACQEVVNDMLGAAARKERRACARIAKGWARSHRDGRKMPSVQAAAWAELSGNWIAERIGLRGHE